MSEALSIPVFDQTPEQRELRFEMEAMVSNHRCGVCRGKLEMVTAEGHLVLVCGTDHSHEGYQRSPSLTERYRQGEPMPLHIGTAIERRRRREINMSAQEQDLVAGPRPGALALDSLEATAGAVVARYNIGSAQALLFTYLALRIGLDPLFGEIVPTVFKNKKSGRDVLVPIITELGWGSLAARACPDAWNGPPSVTPATDPDLKEAVCNDRDAYVWEATGRRKDWEPGRLFTTYGWITQEEVKKARESDPPTPAGRLPSNQARVRAINRWYRETYAEAASMVKAARAEIPDTVQMTDAMTIIEAEYRMDPPAPAGRTALSRCDLHQKDIIKGKYGPYCPTRVPDGKGKEAWCKGVASAPEQASSRPPPEASPAPTGRDPLTGFLTPTGEPDKPLFARFYREQGATDESIDAALGGASLVEWCQQHPGLTLVDLVEDALHR